MKDDDLSQWICIARTGTFNDSDGNPHTFTRSDLEQIAGSYDPKQSEAPLVFGHPKDTAPAYGWVRALKVEGERLLAQFAHVAGEVRECVAKQRYKYVSMSLAKDKRRLLHVGLLGAAAPAIDGLGAVAFGGDDGVTISFSNDGGSTVDIEELARKVVALEAQVNKLTGEKDEAEKGKTAAEDEAKATGAEFAAFKGTVLSQKREQRMQALVESGKLTPAQLPDALSFATALAEVQAPVNFSAADGKQEQVSAEERYFRELENRPADLRAANFATQVPGHIAPAHDPAIHVDITGKL